MEALITLSVGPPIILDGVPFTQHDGGRAGSRRPRQRQDCSVRALAIALAIPYDSAYDMLKSAGRRSGASFALGRWLPGSGIPCTHHTYPAIKGRPRMTLAEFSRTDGRCGDWVVHCAKHFVAVRDGIVFDDSPPRFEACVYNTFLLSGGMSSVIE